MPNLEKIYQECPWCDEMGMEHFGKDEFGDPLNSVVCRTCGGTRILPAQSLSTDLITLLIDMNDKINDIKEKVDEI